MPGLRALLVSAAVVPVTSWSFWNPPNANETTTAEPGSPLAKCAVYPSCVAQANKTIPADGFCCPTSDGTRLDCCAGGLVQEPNATFYNASTAMCVIDVMQAAQMLGRAGTSMNAAVKTCVEGTTNKNKIARCASPVGSVVSSFSYAASFLSTAAAECSESLHIKDFLENTLGWDMNWTNAKAQSAELQAACSGAVTSFTAGLAQIAESGPAMTQSCEWMKNMPGMSWIKGAVTEAGGPSSINRRAQDGSEMASAKELRDNGSLLGWTAGEIRQQEEAECAFDVGQGTMFLAQAGMQINSAVTDCSDYSLKEGGKHAKAMCAVDTSGVIRSFGFVASLLSFAVSNCPIFQLNLDAACSGAIADMVTGIAGLAASGSAFRDTCGFIANATMSMFGGPGEEKAAERRLAI
jgi:hypothetical protein